MKQTDIMFFFDTEDYTDLRSVDAARKIAELFTEEGVTAHFSVVGLVAKQMMDNGCTEAIEALKKHEIGNHTYAHSMHPNISQISDIEDYGAAYAAVAEMESASLALLKEAFGRDADFGVPPGNAVSYAAQYYYADQGLSAYGDCAEYRADRNAVWCCNLMQTTYEDSFEGMAFNDQAQTDPDTDAKIDAMMDRLAKKDWAIVYSHPNMACFKNFWDSVNFKGANLHPDGQYALCDPRSPEEEAHYYDTMRKIIRRFAADDRFNVTALPAVIARQKPRVTLTPADMPMIAAHLAEKYAPVEDPSLALSDLFAASIAFLKGEAAFTPGKAYGLLSPTAELDHPVELTVCGIRKAAAEIPVGGFWPSSYEVDGVKLGWGDMLYAMVGALTAEGERITLAPHPVMTLLDEAPDIKNSDLRSSWMHSPDLKDEYLSDRLRLQVYTIRKAD